MKYSVPRISTYKFVNFSFRACYFQTAIHLPIPIQQKSKYKNMKRVLLEKPMVAQIVKKLPALDGTKNFISVFTKAP